jgi:1,6-anhydro-N-acetylmuramate kinase
MGDAPTRQAVRRRRQVRRARHVHAALLDALLDEPYFTAPPPKSTGRDLFSAAWLDAKLALRRLRRRTCRRR